MIFKEPKFKIGDIGRISKNKTLFDKGYVGNWTEELSRLDSLKAKELKERLSAIYNAISEDTQFELATMSFSMDYKQMGSTRKKCWNISSRIKTKNNKKKRKNNRL